MSEAEAAGTASGKILESERTGGGKDSGIELVDMVKIESRGWGME